MSRTITSPLFYNDESNKTIYDLSRDIMYLARKIRMLNPKLYETEGKELMREIYQISEDYILWSMRN
jgi:hypothetical protein